MLKFPETKAGYSSEIQTLTFSSFLFLCSRHKWWNFWRIFFSLVVWSSKQWKLLVQLEEKLYPSPGTNVKLSSRQRLRPVYLCSNQKLLLIPSQAECFVIKWSFAHFMPPLIFWQSLCRQIVTGDINLPYWNFYADLLDRNPLSWNVLRHRQQQQPSSLIWQ